jgi:hypothetical protein
MKATKYRTPNDPGLVTRRDLSVRYSTQALFNGNIVCASKRTELFLFIAEKVECKRGDK